MSLRDYFAAQFAAANWLAEQQAFLANVEGAEMPVFHETAEASYRFADAMLAARGAKR
jgi:hypothetical protein